MSTISTTDLISIDLIYQIPQKANFSYMRIKNLNQENHISYSSLDFFDYLPLISNISGAIRGLFGLAETIIGIPAFPIQLLGRVIYKPENGHNSFLFNKGISNIVRASLAQGPFIGNIGLYVYDNSPSLKSDFQKAFGINN